MDELFKKLNIEPRNKKIYKTAFAHSSYVNEHKMKSDYERLEFLGDAVLDLVMADYLFRNYREDEGEMTKVKASYVCRNANYCYATDLELEKYILLGNGEQKDGFKMAIVADIFEALMGAIYIDLGYSTVRRIILSVIVPYIENPNVVFFNDYKSSLQEYVQTNQKSIEYRLVEETGPAHDRHFTMEVVISGIAYGRGTATSKKQAEQAAAKEALNKLAKKKTK